ncbi:MAG: sigma-70 family RNA polymerase sigma factor [Candidatus Latescibacteria bacterium]|nr:sigma-70 family RNA polymerase sigma factor [Candidatus Latescibacterota bacterium]
MDRVDIERTLAGDTEAFGQVVQRHAGWLHSRVLGRVRDPVEAEDIVQEVFLSAFTRLRQLQDPDRVAAWLKVIADNLVRRRFRRRLVQQRWQELADQDSLVEQAAADDEVAALRALLRRALGRLTSKHRQVVVYHYFKGYSYAATARQLEIGIETVRSRLQKARRRLQKELDTMADIANTEQVFTLDEADVQALRRARAFASDDPQRPVLQGVCLDVGGRIVATDGSRLYWGRAAGLENLAAPVLLRPWEEAGLPEVGGARLVLGVEEGLLEWEQGGRLRLALMDMPYVDYEKVVPRQSPSRAQVRVGDLLAACAQMDEHLEGRHPVDTAGPWTYTPAVEICISALAGTMTLTTTDTIGYSLKEGVEAVAQASGPTVGWRFETAIAAQVDSGECRLRINHGYLAGAVRGLGLEDGERLYIGFTEALKPVLFEPEEGRGRRTMVMPMRMETPA